MLIKVAEFKGVIVFYLLLVLFLFAMSYQNRLIDTTNESNINIVMTNN